MAKDPAFLFYPNDWLGGTMGMTFEEKGAYIDLLMLQFNRGHLTTHMMGQVVGQLLDKLLIKFKKDDDGLYYNERLEIEIDKRKSFIQTRLNNRLGINQYSKKEGQVTSHMTSHMEDEDEDVSFLSLKGVQGEEPIQEKNGYITPKLFEDFWELYPKKTDKGKAKNKWETLCTKKENRPVWKEIRKALHDQIKSERWENKQFIPMPTTWLNQSRWLDDPKEMVNIKFTKDKQEKIIRDGENWFLQSDGKYRNSEGTLLRD
jgi:hypothetical protein